MVKAFLVHATFDHVYWDNTEHHIKSSTFQNGDTPLHIASAMGRRKLVRIILESNPDCSIVNQQKETAADIAARKGHDEVVEGLRNPPEPTVPANRLEISNFPSNLEHIFEL